MSNAPGVTVVICAYNAAAWLRPAVESILQQTYNDFELLIINDGSTDGTREVALSFEDARIRVIDNPRNLGVVAARNRGLELARSELIASQDADDISHPDRLRRQVEFMKTHLRVAVLGTAAQLIDEKERPLPSAVWFKATTPLALRWQIMFDTPCINSSVMMRRSVVWDELRGYDDDFTASEDFELFSRAAVKHDLANLGDVLVKYRVLPSSLTSRRKIDVIERVRAVYRDNLMRYLQFETPPEEWLDTWIRVNNPRQYECPRQAGQIVRRMCAFHARFVEVHPEAKAEEQIRHHIVYTGVRLASALARVDLQSSMMNSIAALRLDPVLASSTLAQVGLSKLWRGRAVAV